jgi:ATP-dependent Lhr-like helicase
VRFLPEWQGVASGGSLADALDRLEGVPLPWSELERAILPARVKGFDPRALDEQSALGALVWIGAGALGDRDGRVALYRRERAGLLADPPLAPDTLSPLAAGLLAQLTARGALFFGELLAGSGGASAKDALEALFELVWAGLATNDTFAPLRSLGARRPLRRGAQPGGAAGRWSSVASVLAARGAAVSDTERAHARAGVLLERYGVLSREAFAQESWRGGFGGVYPVLRAMEEAGKVRRGHFVEGYQGAQFAYAGAVDRLRAARISAAQGPGVGTAGSLLVLAACDPAVPFGTLLPWPASTSTLARPRRTVGARVALADGALVAFIERGARRLWTFRDANAAPPERVARALRGLFAERSLSVLRLEEIDGEPAAESPLAEALLRGGFRRGYRGLELERSGAASAPA